MAVRRQPVQYPPRTVTCLSTSNAIAAKPIIHCQGSRAKWKPRNMCSFTRVASRLWACQGAPANYELESGAGARFEPRTLTGVDAKGSAALRARSRRDVLRVGWRLGSPQYVVLTATHSVTHRFADVYARFRYRLKGGGVNDFWIAATVLGQQEPPPHVTDNRSDFERIASEFPLAVVRPPARPGRPRRLTPNGPPKAA